MTTRRTARFPLTTFAAILVMMLLPAPDGAAQPLPPRLVVFEGFYNPG